MATVVLLNKPFQVLSQFTDDQGRATLAQWIKQPGLYAAGRLDYDSEGLLLLTDDGRLQQRITDPRFKLEKTYWVQVEGDISDPAIEQLCRGVELKDGATRPARCKRLTAMQTDVLWPRNPPIRQRNNDITCWIELKIKEGRNRQVRRMTAAVGHPTLRLIRMAIGNWSVDTLSPGQHRSEPVNLPQNSAETAKRHPRGGVTRKPKSTVSNRSGAQKRPSRKSNR
ncbi:MAG: pseudouridine synthase [Motiliproteus sp.]